MVIIALIAVGTGLIATVFVILMCAGDDTENDVEAQHAETQYSELALQAYEKVGWFEPWYNLLSKILLNSENFDVAKAIGECTVIEDGDTVAKSFVSIFEFHHKAVPFVKTCVEEEVASSSMLINIETLICLPS